ncbi:MarC family protein [uncultured Sphingomonas sp.]|uniref:MarC family protein n=1 Tax=uncultured Sphingomonas sp. TaxID=158754 RepID=UPI0035CB79C7
MLQHFLSAFVTLFVVIDPPGCAPIFAGLTSGAGDAQRRAMALKSTLIAALILLLFALLGEPLLKMLGISLDAFRIAGGVMLALIALEMVFERRTERRAERVHKVRERPEPIQDVSVFPMAMPMIAGPGSIASAMLLMGKSHGTIEHAIVLAALLAVLALMLVALFAAGALMRLVGESVEGVITRLLGVLLAALAAQFILDGLKGAFGL